MGWFLSFIMSFQLWFGIRCGYFFARAIPMAINAALRGGQQETVPTGFLHLPAGRRYALHP
jgi:hypothetical protein